MTPQNNFSYKANSYNNSYDRTAEPTGSGLARDRMNYEGTGAEIMRNNSNKQQTIARKPTATDGNMVYSHHSNFKRAQDQGYGSDNSAGSINRVSQYSGYVSDGGQSIGQNQ